MTSRHKKRKLLVRNVTIASIVAFLILGLVLYIFLRSNSVSKIESVLDATTTPVKISEKLPAPDLLGRASLSYAGGTVGRHRNIEIGVARINGTVVQPGEEFSFTKSLGLVRAQDGFTEQKVFLNGEVTTGIGGGLCQVSTVLFRSLLQAGLPITERHNHTFTVAKYDVGLDATYSDPGPDLKFKNDTLKPIVIRGKTENKNAIFEIYGTSDGRVANTSDVNITNVIDFPPTKYINVATREADKPECINTPQIGYTAEVTYNVLYPNGIQKEDVFISNYKPLQRVCYIVGTE
ncbi:VanW family protein [Patescibacteria group bacterium]|nr:VanW family protein [Patescibacteria group bacterium]